MKGWEFDAEALYVTAEHWQKIWELQVKRPGAKCAMKRLMPKQRNQQKYWEKTVRR